MSSASALLPLRVFLGVTFVYAGVHKLSDPGFLTSGAPTYIGTQLEAFSDGTPAGFVLRELALPAPELAGVGVALLEIGVGVLALAGVSMRAAAAAGLGLNLLLFLTATWRTSPYFLGSDIVFAFAWLPFLLAGAEGQPTLDELLRRRPLRRRHAPALGPAAVTRRAALGQALALAAGATAAIAGGAALARGSYQRSRLAAGAARAPGGRAPAGFAAVAESSALRPGDALRFDDPASRKPALLLRTPEGRAAALSAVCTHAGCEVEWREGTIECPCHGAVFDPASGAPRQGPARDPLARLSVIEQDGRIYARRAGGKRI
jgi:thiosulfate dehydrogenase (quinone) large subunit